MKKLNLREIALCGVLAALYAGITIATASFAYGPIQFRVADALCVLPFFLPVSSVGLALGCLIANLFSPVSALDIVIGSAATLVGCVLTARVRRRFLAPLPTILANTVMVGAMLSAVLTPQALLPGFLTFGAQVALGETAVMTALGLPLLTYLDKSRLLERLVGPEKVRRCA